MDSFQKHSSIDNLNKMLIILWTPIFFFKSCFFKFPYRAFTFSRNLICLKHRTILGPLSWVIWFYCLNLKRTSNRMARNRLFTCYGSIKTDFSLDAKTSNTSYKQHICDILYISSSIHQRDFVALTALAWLPMTE